MERYLVRVWLPDRPGALGAVASRIGAVRGDVVGIDILETGGGEAIDELVVQLPQVTPVALLVSEIEEVDGVRVEEVRPVAAESHDPRVDALESAAALVTAPSGEALLGALCEQVARILTASWVAVVNVDAERVLTSSGAVPPVPWLSAFLAGSHEGGATRQLVDVDTDDVVWSPLRGATWAVVAGREGCGYRARERRQLAAMARIVDCRLAELERR